jgi:hypothetical protein
MTKRRSTRSAGTPTSVAWLGVAACFVAAGCASNECVLDDDLRLFAGEDAVDCGSADPAHDRAEIDKCAANAFDAGQPFIARYRRMGVESTVVNAVASNTDGKVKVFRWDSAPCGGDGCSSVTDVQSCDGPTLSQQTSSDPTALPIDCDSLGLAQRICGG